VPASDEQLFLLKQLAPFLPAPPRAGRGAYSHARTADMAIATALTGGAAAAGAPPLPSRAALIADSRRLWAAGLRPRYAWMGLNREGDLCLDLLSGSYIWLRRVREGVGKAQGDKGDDGAGGGGAAAAAADAGDLVGSGGAASGPFDPESWPPLDPEAQYVVTLQLPGGQHVPLTHSRVTDEGLFGLGPPTPTAGGGGGGGGASGGARSPSVAPKAEDGGGGGRSAAQRAKSASAVQAVQVPLARAIARAEAIAGRLQARRLAFLSQRQAARIVGAVGGWKIGGHYEGHHTTPAGEARSCPWGEAGRPPWPSGRQWRGVGRFRVDACPSAGGWRNMQRWEHPPASRTAPAPRGKAQAKTARLRPPSLFPTSSPPLPRPSPGARQLEVLREHGLPVSRRYTALDAHRELTRHLKSRGLPDPPATPAQAARMRELGLDGGDPAAAAGGTAPALTFAQARARLFRAAVAEEEAEAGGALSSVKRRPRWQRERRGMTFEALKKRAKRQGLRHMV
jgi:hypothetical protein